MYIHKMQIGNVELQNNIILAPMAGITDKAFRQICSEFSPGLMCTEMVSSKAILYNDEKTKKLMNIENEKKPISIQIFGSDLESMEYAAKEVSKTASIIDINMGCPVPKVVKNGDGSKLLLELEKAATIIKTVVKNATVPVTVKFRKGWDNDHIVATDIAQIAEENGASAITIHGRTRSEFYSGKVDLDIIKKVKEAVNIPVIGNGDIVDEETALKMFEYTGVDGIMIGRGAFGNPWIFEKIKYFLQNGQKMGEITSQEKLDIIKQHIEYCIQDKGELTAIKEMRKHIAYYTKNLKNASSFRCFINTIESKEELIHNLEDFFEKCD